MSASNQSPKSCLYYVGILLGITILGTLLPLFVLPVVDKIEQNQTEQRAQIEQRFQYEMPSYTGVFPTAVSDTILHGKIIVINPIEKKIDPLYYELPRQYRAKTPAEVNVLVWLECHVLDSFSYGGLNSFFTIDLESCKVTVTDWATKSVVYQTEFTGKRPEDEIWVSDSNSVMVQLQEEAAVDRRTIVKWLMERIK